MADHYFRYFLALGLLFFLLLYPIYLYLRPELRSDLPIYKHYCVGRKQLGISARRHMLDIYFDSMTDTTCTIRCDSIITVGYNYSNFIHMWARLHNSPR